MNIFVLDEDPNIAARYHCDKHVNKMLLESAQILNTAIHLRGDNKKTVDQFTFYKPTHQQHPVVLWAAESFNNWSWLYSLMIELNEEYLYRYVDESKHAARCRWTERDVYDPDKWHKSFRKASDTWGGPHFHKVKTRVFDERTENEMTKWAHAIPDEYDCLDTVQAYRNYYKGEKSTKDWFGYERGREAPDWL